MKLMHRNQKVLYYCPFFGTAQVFNKSGEAVGEKPVYGKPVRFRAFVSNPSGEEVLRIFGMLDNYSRVIMTDDMKCGIDEKSVLFIDKEPTFNADGEPLYNHIVSGISKSPNHISIAVREVQVS